MTRLVHRLSAEAFGTAALVATVVGSGVMAEQLAQDPALALLANALATSGMLFVLISLFGPVSGAQLNPVVTMVCALRRELTAADAAAYIGAQVFGALAGAALAHGMFDLPVFQLSDHVRAGPGQFLSELVATFGLVLVVLRLGGKPGTLPAAVALYIGAAYWFTASTSFANPAVTLARAFTDTFSGIALGNVPAFIAAQVAGALLALTFATWLPRQDAAS